MKAIFVSFLGLFFASSIFAIGDYSKGEALYIWATSGLNMRTAPDAKASKTANLPFGTRVIVIDKEVRSHPFRYTMVASEKASWAIDGHWVEVQFGDMMGYVFDGYLSKLPMITNGPAHHPYFEQDRIKDFGKTHWGGLKEETKTTRLDFEANQRDADKGRSSSYKLTFNNGAYYERVEESFSGYTSVFIKDISLEEAYLFFNAMTGFEFTQKEQKEQGGKSLYHDKSHLSKVAKGELYFIGDGMSSVTIEAVDGGVLIQSGGGC